MKENKEDRVRAKTVCLFGLVLIYVFVLAFFVTDASPDVLVAAGLGYTGVLAAWLGYDMAALRDRTLSKKKGQYATIHVGRYLFGIFTVASLLMVTLLRDPGGVFTTVKVALIPCVLTPAGILIGAYGANKTATMRGPEGPADAPMTASPGGAL